MLTSISFLFRPTLSTCRGLFKCVQVCSSSVFKFVMGNIWDKVFKNGRSKIYGKQPLKN